MKKYTPTFDEFLNEGNIYNIGRTLKTVRKTKMFFDLVHEADPDISMRDLKDFDDIDINSGFCWAWAETATILLQRANIPVTIMFGEKVYDSRFSDEGHWFIKVGEKYYDSGTLQGVDDPNKLFGTFGVAFKKGTLSTDHQLNKK